MPCHHHLSSLSSREFAAATSRSHEFANDAVSRNVVDAPSSRSREFAADAESCDLAAEDTV